MACITRGWLNTNATWRNATQARANALNVEYGRLVAQRRGTFKNFKLLYFNPNLESLIMKYMNTPVPPAAAAKGLKRRRTDCIEPCDGKLSNICCSTVFRQLCQTDLMRSPGFHPSQTLNQLYAAEIWDWLEAQHPDVLGPVNPYNEAIEKKFGYQGGY